MEFDIVNFSEKTGWNLNFLKHTLGVLPLKLCSAATIAEAAEAYVSAEENSEEELAAYLRIKELVDTQAGNMSMEEAKKILEDFEDTNYEILLTPVRERVIQLSSTAEELCKALEIALFPEHQKQVLGKLWMLDLTGENGLNVLKLLNEVGEYTEFYPSSWNSLEKLIKHVAGFDGYISK